MNIGEITVDQGDKFRGVLKITTRPDGSLLNIPVMAVNGTKDGPTLVVSAGIHGDEFEGMETIRRLWRALDPNKINGVFIGVPVVNALSFEAGSTLTPIDNLNAWRVFPGKPNGLISEKIAYIFSTKILSHAEYYIDLHSGGTTLSVVPFTLITKDEKKFVNLARAVKFGFIVMSPLTGTPIAIASRKGIPAIAVEIGGEGRCYENNIDMLFTSITNVMKYIGMLEGKPEIAKKYTVLDVHPPYGWTFAESGGFFIPMVKAGDHVEKDTNLGKILDTLGEQFVKYEAPYDGIILDIRTFPGTNPGDRLINIGRIVRTISR